MTIDFDDDSLRTPDKAIEIAPPFQAATIVVHVVPRVLDFTDILFFHRYQEQQRAAGTTFRRERNSEARGCYVLIGNISAMLAVVSSRYTSLSPTCW